MQPHDKAALTASASATAAATDDNRRSGDAPFVNVAISPAVAVAGPAVPPKPTKRMCRMPRWAWFDRAMTPDTVAAAALRIGIFAVLIVATAIGYAISMQRWVDAASATNRR